VTGEGTVDVALAVLQLYQAAGLHAVAELGVDEDLPVVRVEENGGAPTSSQGPNRLTKQDLNIDTWGSSKTQAQQLMATARDLLLAAPRVAAVQAAAVLVSARANSPQWLPDEDWPVSGRPAPRYLVTVTVTGHPTPSS
jgi:hypothetical protein